jgi:peptidoglycan/LPS O-acetylase OafA/YrhL
MSAVAGGAPHSTALEHFGGAQGRTGHRLQLDGLRGLMMLTVVLAHAALGSKVVANDTWYGRVIFEFRFAVPVFFMLSGFLLYRPFFAARMRGRPSPSRARFFKRRLARILPAYWVALTLCGLFLGATGVFGHRWYLFYGFGQIYSTATQRQGLAVAWTLCAELAFYLSLPLIDLAIRALARLLRTPTQSWRLDLGFLLILGALSFAFRVWVGHVDLVLQQSLFGVFDWLLPGMLLAIVTVIYADREVSELPGWIRLVARKPLYCWLAAGVLILLNIPLLNGSTYQLHPAAITSLAYDLDFLLQGTIAALVVAPAMLPGTDAGLLGQPRRLLAAPVLCWLGTISYGIYLWHLPIMSELFKLGLFSLPGSRTVNLFIAALVPSIVIAAASWYLMEKPLLNRAG